MNNLLKESREVFLRLLKALPEKDMYFLIFKEGAELVFDSLSELSKLYSNLYDEEKELEENLLSDRTLKENKYVKNIVTYIKLLKELTFKMLLIMCIDIGQLEWEKTNIEYRFDQFINFFKVKELVEVYYKFMEKIDTNMEELKNEEEEIYNCLIDIIVDNFYYEDIYGAIYINAISSNIMNLIINGCKSLVKKECIYSMNAKGCYGEEKAQNTIINEEISEFAQTCKEQCYKYLDLPYRYINKEEIKKEIEG